MFEKITKTLSGLAFIKYINSLIDYVNTSDIDATRIKGQLDISNIPPAGLDNVIKVDTVTDMLALTVDDVQNGDTVMIIGVTPPVQYQVVDDTKLGTMDAFQEYAAGTATKALADINGNNIHTTYGKLAGNNTWTGTNTYNRNIYITNGSSAGSSGTLYLGVKPTNETVQARIGTDKLGGLFYHASTNQPHVFRVGTNNNVFVIRDDNTKVTFSSNNNPFATVTHDGVATWLGNANTATKLETARTINGVAFDGTKDITIGADVGAWDVATTEEAIAGVVDNKVMTPLKVKSAIEAQVPIQTIINLIYPVGSIYMSVNSTSPADLFGGTWEAMPAGRVLLAQGTSEWGVEYKAGSTGGTEAETLTIEQIPSHNHDATTNSTGAHTHNITVGYDVADGTGWGKYLPGSNSTLTTNSTGTHSHTVNISNSGGGESHNNMQPYIAVYIWMRTA